MLYCRLPICFKIRIVINFRYTIRVSKSLDPDQARRFVRPDPGPNCLLMLSVDGKSRNWQAKCDCQETFTYWPFIALMVIYSQAVSIP